jgi:hypothetical protein
MSHQVRPANSDLSFKDKLDDNVSVFGACMRLTALHLHVAVFEPV